MKQNFPAPYQLNFIQDKTNNAYILLVTYKAMFH